MSELSAARSLRAAHIRMGSQGERVVANILKRRGWDVIGQNIRAEGVRGEIDLILYKEGEGQLVLVEVKTRGSDQFGYAEGVVDQQKLQRLLRVWRAVCIQGSDFGRFYGEEPTFLVAAVAYENTKWDVRLYWNIGLDDVHSSYTSRHLT